MQEFSNFIKHAKGCQILIMQTCRNSFFSLKTQKFKSKKTNTNFNIILHVFLEINYFDYQWLITVKDNKIVAPAICKKITLDNNWRSCTYKCIYIMGMYILNKLTDSFKALNLHKQIG